MQACEYVCFAGRQKVIQYSSMNMNMMTPRSDCFIKSCTDKFDLFSRLESGKSKAVCQRDVAEEAGYVLDGKSLIITAVFGNAQANYL